MSVFSLGPIARAAKKNARSIRRWCEEGRVPGAFQTSGGHWRVRGESPARIVAKCDVAGFARRRKPPRHLRELNRAFSRMSKLVQRPAHQVLMRAVEAIDLPEDALLELGLPANFWEISTAPPSRRVFDAIKAAALATWILKAGDRGGPIGKSNIIREANNGPNRGGNRPLSRRSFERYFGHCYPAALGAVAVIQPPADSSPGFFGKDGEMVAGTFHSASTPEEVRRFSGACAPKSTTHVERGAGFARWWRS
jgi:hypothetical protein